MRVDLPWPPTALWPNRRVHRMQQYAAQRKFRADAGIAARAGGLRQIEADGLHVTITFQPPDMRRRDTDNMLAAIKSGLDGIADVIGVDDSRWSLTLRRDAPVRGGNVAVQIETGGAG